jgi:hypothetical protein
MPVFLEDPALSRRDHVRRIVLSIALIVGFLGGVVLFALFIGPHIGAAGGCGGG